jgi:hypothetical protein
MAEIEKVPTGKHHPGYGCAIFIIAILVLGGSITWMIYSGLEQDRQISTFTVEEAPPLQTATPSAEQKDELKKRLADFSKASAAGPAKLSLNVTDLNTLVVLCADTGLKDADYRGIVWFTGMDAKDHLLKADIRWKMNNLPFTQRKDRYLVGKADFKPEIEGSGVDLRIDDLTVPDKKVPEGFVGQLHNMPWLNVVKTKPEIAEVLKRVTSAQVTPEGSLILEAKPLPPAK